MEVKQDGENFNHAFDSLNNALPDETTLTYMISDNLIYNLASSVIDSFLVYILLWDVSKETELEPWRPMGFVSLPLLPVTRRSFLNLILVLRQMKVSRLRYRRRYVSLLSP